MTGTRPARIRPSPRRGTRSRDGRAGAGVPDRRRDFRSARRNGRAAVAFGVRSCWSSNAGTRSTVPLASGRRCKAVAASSFPRKGGVATDRLPGTALRRERV